MQNEFRINEYVFSMWRYRPHEVSVHRTTEYGECFDGQFGLHPEVHHIPYSRPNARDRFSPAECNKIVALIQENLTLFNFDALQAYKTMPDHHRLVDKDSDLYDSIVSYFNPAPHWRKSAQLQVHWYHNQGERFTREFVQNAFTSPQITESEIVDYVESVQFDMFTYDDPPDPEEYFEEAKIPFSMDELGLRKISVYAIDDIQDMFLVQCEATKKLPTRWRARERMRMAKKIALGMQKPLYVVRDDSLYRRVYIPGEFIGEGGFIFMQ
ncbi:MAG: hypothetical protein DHS20C16_19340 [Phycisphaerae bacterium]|nr:MAG: hypothetical protein DHS20C16_19340 [Phycisphaerae bacterium]